jgi:hypothetical protein
MKFKKLLAEVVITGDYSPTAKKDPETLATYEKYKGKTTIITGRASYNGKPYYKLAGIERLWWSESEFTLKSEYTEKPITPQSEKDPLVGRIVKLRSVPQFFRECESPDKTQVTPSQLKIMIDHAGEETKITGSLRTAYGDEYYLRIDKGVGSWSKDTFDLVEEKVPIKEESPVETEKKAYIVSVLFEGRDELGLHMGRVSAISEEEAVAIFTEKVISEGETKVTTPTLYEILEIKESDVQ